MRLLIRSFAAIAAASLLLPLLAAPAAPAPTTAASAPTPTQVADRPLLRLGDTGPSVAAWQRQLRIVTGADVPVDGVYGTSTETATANLQRFFGLRVDGIVGENTRELVRFLLAVDHDLFELASDLEGSGLRVVGYQGEQGYCLEVQDGDQVAVECAEPSGAPI
ncbi:MAG TPA: peptidoglycan-binding domain-containing protein, partial [Acidimicrobiales bacterium]|nr:peptidoglycan-binding domain-containing protein [Acidimicrobiales bacterium]